MLATVLCALYFKPQAIIPSSFFCQLRQGTERGNMPSLAVQVNGRAGWKPTLSGYTVLFLCCPSIFQVLSIFFNSKDIYGRFHLSLWHLSQHNAISWCLKSQGLIFSEFGRLGSPKSRFWADLASGEVSSWLTDNHLSPWPHKVERTTSPGSSCLTKTAVQ